MSPLENNTDSRPLTNPGHMLSDKNPVTSVTNGNLAEETDTSVQDEDSNLDPDLVWAPSGRRLISGLLGLNVVLLGTALVTGQAFNSQGFKHQEPQLFILLLMGLSLVWMLWYLLWARKQPGISPYKDHHAGGITITVVLMIFAAVSLLLHIFRMGYYAVMSKCYQLAKVAIPFVEAPFLGFQTYLLWAHSKDCIHEHKVLTRSGLMVILSADLLMWLNAVTDDTIHQEIELEREAKDAEHFTSHIKNMESPDLLGINNTTLCRCGANAACHILRKGYEVLYPFNIEYYLMASCMLYVMWKNVSRKTIPGSLQHTDQKLTLQMVQKGGLLLGPLFGGFVLVAGATVFILYQVWVSRPLYRYDAFLMFYGYHLVVMPVMCLCTLAGMLVHKLERRAEEAEHNPTRSLDVILLVGAALGQLALSYFCLVSALAMGTSGTLGSLDLSYSLLSLIELMLQNIFIIQGLHRHPSLSLSKKKGKQMCVLFKPKKKGEVKLNQVNGTNMSSAEKSDTVAPPDDQTENCTNSRYKRVTQEIYVFLILSNVVLWVIPAFGANPQFENGIGKEFFGFTPWFILVNLGQPLGVFYRMHSVGALMELLISA